MSTRSNIAILLRPEDRNKDFKTPWGEVVNANGKKYLYVYCHHDGYPEGVGADLIHMFDGGDYKDVINYIMLGDRTSSDLSYWDWRKEQCAPDAADTEEEMYQNDYLYILEEVDGTMRVRMCGDDDDEDEGDEDAYYISISKEPDGSFRVKQYTLDDEPVDGIDENNLDEIIRE